LSCEKSNCWTNAGRVQNPACVLSSINRIKIKNTCQIYVKFIVKILDLLKGNKMDLPQRHQDIKNFFLEPSCLGGRNKTKNMKVRPSVVIIENDCVLLMRYRYGQTDVYNLPGGNVDKGETLAQTVVRELQEELGIEIAVKKMILAGEVLMPEPKKDVLHCVFLAKIIEGKPILNLMETSALEVVWKPIKELSSLDMYPNVGADLQKILLEDVDFQYVGRVGQAWYG
jgi:8-oxo-dGTP diphosphatase